MRQLTLTAKTRRSAVVSQIEALDWSAILRSCSAWDAYKAYHGVEVHPRQAAEFLLFNDDFPRSVRFCVSELNDAMRRISGVAEGRFCNDCGKIGGPAGGGIAIQHGGGNFRPEPASLSRQSQIKLNDIGNALFDAYIFQPFKNPDGEHMVQQEEQQQQ